LTSARNNLAPPFAVHSVKHHKKRTRFFSTVELVNALEQESVQGKVGQIADASAMSI